MEIPILHPTRSSVALAIKVSVVLLATIAFFHQDLAIITNEALESEFMSYMIAIPFLFVYVLYRKRKMLRAVVSLEPADRRKETKHLATIAGFLISAIAVFLYWYGSYTFTPLEYHMIALPIFIAGLVLIFFNPTTLRQLAFPIIFLTFLIPPPSLILYGLGATLSVVNAEISNMIINTLGIHSTLSSEYGNPILQITKPNGATLSFTVDIACSGVYSLIGFLIFAVFVVYITRGKPWKRAVIFPIGFLVIYLLNTTRITAILLIGYHYGEEAALQIFHLLGGWVLIFLGTMLLLIIAEKILKIQIFAKSAGFAQCQDHPETFGNTQNFCLSCGRLRRYPEAKLKKLDVAKILAIALTVVLFLSIQAPVFALTQAPAEIALYTPSGEQTTTEILPQIPGYALNFIYRDKRFEQLTKQDASLLYAYVPENMTKETLWVTIEIASKLSLLHGWETCLVTWPQNLGYLPKVTQLDLKQISILENPPIFARYFVFQYVETNQTQAVIYWNEKSTFQTNATLYDLKYVEISVFANLNSPETIPEIEKQLIKTAGAIVQYWQPIRNWAQITILISQNGDKLIATTVVLSIGVIVMYAIERRKKRRMNSDVYRKLSNFNKRIVDIVHETERTIVPTLSNIAITYRNNVKRRIDKEKLLHTLRETEKLGLVRSEVANKEDEPLQIWRTNMFFAKT